MLVLTEKDRIRQIALEKFEKRMHGDRAFWRVPVSPFQTLPGYDFVVNETIRYFPEFLHNTLRRIFIFPEAVMWTTGMVAQFDDRQNKIGQFNKECESCVVLVGDILERLSLFNPQEELDFLDKYESWCEKAKKQLKDLLAAMEQNEKMSLTLFHRAQKLKKERNALAEQLQTFVGRVIGKIAKKIEWDQNRDQRRKATEHRKITSQKAEQSAPDNPAETEQKEIVEVKPGAFGITVNIKEIAKRIWKRVCSRRKD